ncbi:MAG: hypothetical protein WBV70_07160 [Candidatus Bathyarchaeia archaeon]
MDPLDFYGLAKELRTKSSNYPEALKRTIVGRFYYAIFLMVRDELGVALRGSQAEPLYSSISQMGAIHTLVVDALSKIERDRHLSNVLYGMRRRRDTADYRTQTLRKLNWDSEIDDIVSMADEVLQNRPGLQPSFSQKLFEIETFVTFWHSKVAASP